MSFFDWFVSLTCVFPGRGGTAVGSLCQNLTKRTKHGGLPVTELGYLMVRLNS